MKVRVVTDSAASLPADLAAAEGVVVVPLRLTLAGRDLRDGEVPIAEVLATPPGDTQTSGPPPGEFTQAIAGADAAVVLTISSEMSSTYDSARLGAQLSDTPSVVIDTETAAGAEGLVVLSAARAAAAGASMDEVADVARRAMQQVRLVAAVEDLGRLVDGGRVPAVAGRAGRMLGVYPMFAFRDGKVRRLAPAAGRQRAIGVLVRKLNRARRSGEAFHVAVLHASDPEGAAEVAGRVRKASDPATLFVGEFSPVMVAHTGPLLGVAWHAGD